MSMMKCPRCGKDLPTESAFCPYCMEQIKTPVAVSVPLLEKKSRKGLSVMILITALVVLVVALLTILRFCGNNGSESPAESTDGSSPTVNEKVDVNNSVGIDGQEVVQGEPTTDASEPQASDNVTDTPTDVISENTSNTAPTENVPVNGTTQGVTDNGNNNVTTTAPQPSGCNHSYVAQYETVYHEEEGHYEDVEKYRTITKYKCAVCSNKFSSISEYYSHFDSTHTPLYEGDPIKAFREQYTTSTDYEYYTESQWVVDKKAYSEEIITGYKCSKCGKER